MRRQAEPAAPLPRVGDAARPRLARLTLEAASSLQGVVATDAGPHGLYVTDDPPAGVLRGVLVVAQADGRYSVDVRLVAELVPLPALGARVRNAVHKRAEREGLSQQLGTVAVQFARVVSAEEVDELTAQTNQGTLASADTAAPGGPPPSPAGPPPPRPRTLPPPEQPSATETASPSEEAVVPRAAPRTEARAQREPGPASLGTMTVQFARPVSAKEIHELAERAREEVEEQRRRAGHPIVPVEAEPSLGPESEP